MRNKGFSYYYRIECYEGYQNNRMIEGKSFNELYKKFTGRKIVDGKSIKDFVDMYDSGQTNAYYHIHCVFVKPDGEEKIIYTCRGL